MCVYCDDTYTVWRIHRGYCMSEPDKRDSLKPKDLVWIDFEDYEKPFLLSANGMIYGYLVIEDGDKYSLSYYNLFGGENLKEEMFDTVEDAQYFAISHHKKVMDSSLKHYWEAG